MVAAAASRPTYVSNQSGRISLYFRHQSSVLDCLTSARNFDRVSSSVTPYKVSRSVTSRLLSLTRPFSSRLILERDARIS